MKLNMILKTAKLMHAKCEHYKSLNLMDKINNSLNNGTYIATSLIVT